MRISGFFCGCLLAGAAWATPSDGYFTSSGIATARHASAFLYGERHVLHYQGGRLVERGVLYTCRDGRPFARKVVQYVDSSAPDFDLEDAATGLREGIRSDPGGRTVFFRASQSDPDKSGPLPRVNGLVADAGFDEFVRGNWQRLLSDQTLQMRFLVPSRLDDYAFQVQHLRSEAYAGIPTEVFRLRLSGFWGWFLPAIDVYYGAADHVLVHYDGLSDLRNAAGDNFQAELTFKPADRQDSDERAMQELRAAPLAASR